MKTTFLILLIIVSNLLFCQTNKKTYSNSLSNKYWQGVFEDSIAKISSTGYFGLINKSGKVLCAPKYDAIKEFRNGVAVVELNGKFGLINAKCEEIIPVKYDFVSPSNESLVVIRVADKFSYYDVLSSQEISISFKYALPFSDGLAGVKLNGKWGFIDKTGKAIIKPTYDTIRMPFKNSMAIVVKDNRYSIINKEGKELASYDNFVILPFSNRLFKVVKSYDSTINFGYSVHHLQCDSTGIIDSVGNVIFPVQGGSVGSLVNGYTSISTNPFWQPCIMRAIEGFESKRYGIIDSNGQVIIPCTYEYIDCLEKICLAQRFCPCGFNIKENKLFSHCGTPPLNYLYIVNKKGALKKQLHCDNIIILDGELLSISVNNKWGIINFDGEEIIPATYDELGDTISEGIIAASDSGKWGFINLRNEIVVDFIYDEVGSFTEDKAIVRIENEWGGIDRKGKVIIPIEYHKIFPYSNKLFLVKHNDNWIIIDKNNNIVSKNKYLSADKYYFGLIVSSRVDDLIRYGYVDASGNEIVPCKYDRISIFLNDIGLIIAQKNHKYYLVDKTGKLITANGYYVVDPFLPITGLIKVQNQNGVGFIDLTGREVIPCHYSNALDFTEGLTAVQKDSKWGYINKKGEIVIDFIYDEAFPFTNGVALVKRNESSFYINRDGDRVRNGL